MLFVRADLNFFEKMSQLRDLGHGQGLEQSSNELIMRRESRLYFSPTSASQINAVRASVSDIRPSFDQSTTLKSVYETGNVPFGDQESLSKLPLSQALAVF